MADEEVKSLDEFLDNKRADVRELVLSGILSFTTTPENRARFEQTNVIKKIIRLVGDEVWTKIALCCLVNFAQDEVYRKRMIELGAISRLIEYAEDLVKNIATLGRKDEERSVTRKVEEEDIDDIQAFNVGKVSEKFPVDLVIMLLSNLTQEDEGKLKVLDLENPSMKGFYLWKLLRFYGIQDYEHYFHLISNIITNLSSLEVGRKFFLEESKIFLKIVSFINHPNNLRKLGTLRTVRNCLFEYEEFLDFFVEKADIASYLLPTLIVTNYSDEAMKEQVFQNRPEWKKLGTKSGSSMNETNSLVVECLLLVANQDRGLAYLKKNSVNSIVEKIMYMQHIRANEELDGKMQALYQEVHTYNEEEVKEMTEEEKQKLEEEEKAKADQHKKELDEEAKVFDDLD